MIVWMASYPRSGNTLLAHVLHRVFGFRTYSVYPRARPSNRASGRYIGLSELDRPIPELALRSEPYWIKTHELPAGDAYPAVVIVRDGRDSLVSYAHFILSHEGGSDFRQVLDDLIRYEASYAGWGTHVWTWMRRRPRPAIIKYEELAREPVETVRRAAREIKVPLPRPGGIPTSFDVLHKQMPRFFRQGKAGSFRTEMPEELQRAFWLKFGGVMQELGYEK
jgi:hypothetical protein